MSRRLICALRAGLLLLLLTSGFCASQVITADAVNAALMDGGGGGGGGGATGGGNCATASNNQVAAGTRVCKGTNGYNSAGVCSTVQNGIKTCAVRTLGNGLEYLALAITIAGIFMSGALWAAGSHGQNPGQELTGKRGLIVCVVAAFMIGTFPSMTSFWEKHVGAVDGGTGVATAPPATVDVKPPTPAAKTPAAKAAPTIAAGAGGGTQAQAATKP